MSNESLSEQMIRENAAWEVAKLRVLQPRRTDGLLSMSKAEIELQALRDVAKLVVLALLVGLALVPFVLPWGAQ